LHNDKGEFIGRRGSNRDITQRRKAEDTLRLSEARFRALILNSSDIIRVLDHDGRITYESPSAERILGYPEGSLLGNVPWEHVHPDDLERVKHEFATVSAGTNTGIPTEFRVRKNDGTYLWVEAVGVNLLGVPGVDGFVITTRPIQQRKEAEQALHESEERLRLALEGAEIASWDWDLLTGNAVFSDNFYTMLDHKPGEFPATYDAWAALMHPDDRERVLLDLQRQIAEKRPLCEIEYRLLSNDGNWIWILGRGKISQTDAQGKATRLTGVNIDITNRRLMESEIRSLNTVLEQRVKDRTEALSRANEALEEENAQRVTAEKKLQASVDEKSMLLKEIHHRVKNNLQIIASLLNLQSRYIKDEPTLAAIRESQNRVKAMALVHEKLYRAEDISHISLEDYIKFLGTGLFQFYDARARGIQFRLDIHDVNVDINSAIPLGLIINELISNSLKYAFPEGRKGEIGITVKKEGHTLTVVFQDTGIGIPAGLDWKNTPSLGLRLVNTLVDQMNGTIELDRENGTKFVMVMHEKA
ncbi:MAG: PAS domain-containing protein, partial [Methanomicrobiales archaeon]|nr:PAS domain-containing protein [Methanomicrobiales archaeon]